jgi:hypothetical protein
MNDLHVRDRIELVIRNGNNNNLAIGTIISQVNEIDEMLKGLFQDGISVKSNSDKWYYNGVLKYAGQQYIECMKAHGSHVALI